jgi:urea transport system ATP-binding protein
VEQYLDFARELADSVVIMDRGRIVFTGEVDNLDEPDVRRHLML